MYIEFKIDTKEMFSNNQEELEQLNTPVQHKLAKKQKYLTHPKRGTNKVQNCRLELSAHGLGLYYHWLSTLTKLKEVGSTLRQIYAS